MELASASRYIVHSETCSNWGYKKLKIISNDLASEEITHSRRLIERIFFLEGSVNLGNENSPIVGTDVVAQLNNDLNAEEEILKFLNDTIGLARNLRDSGTVSFLTKILRDEERHIRKVRAQLDDLNKYGTQYFSLKQLSGYAGTLREAREQFECDYIYQKLTEHGWNISKTANT